MEWDLRAKLDGTERYLPYILVPEFRSLTQDKTVLVSPIAGAMTLVRNQSESVVIRGCDQQLLNRLSPAPAKTLLEKKIMIFVLDGNAIALSRWPTRQDRQRYRTFLLSTLAQPISVDPSSRALVMLTPLAIWYSSR